MIKLKGLSVTEVDNLMPYGILPEDMIFLGYRGSITHGTYRPPKHPNSIDDKDLIGVFGGSVEHYLGFGRKETAEKVYKEWDCVYYEIRKMVALLKKGNPNVLSTLWLPDKHILKTSDIWDTLIDHRELFVTKQAYHAFAGYAASQFKRMDHLAYNGRMGEKRKQLVQKHGYDTKNAAHLIRLLNMAIEFLTEGRMYVERPEAPELLAIKDGKYSLEEVKAKAEVLFQQAKAAYQSSTLPDSPDDHEIEWLCVGLVEDALHHAG